MKPEEDVDDIHQPLFNHRHADPDDQRPTDDAKMRIVQEHRQERVDQSRTDQGARHYDGDGDATFVVHHVAQLCKRVKEDDEYSCEGNDKKTDTCFSCVRWLGGVAVAGATDDAEDGGNAHSALNEAYMGHVDGGCVLQIDVVEPGLPSAWCSVLGR